MRSAVGETAGRATARRLRRSCSQPIEREREQLWRERVQQVNWELFDRGAEAFTWYALGRSRSRRRKTASLLAEAARAARRPSDLPQAALDVQLGKTVRRSRLRAVSSRCARSWKSRFAEAGLLLAAPAPGPKGDLVDDEMGRVLQVPGWSNIFTQPIINRIEMLSTGVRTDIGVKVFGPDLETIDRVCKEIEAALKPINGARDVVAAPIMGKGYVRDRHRPRGGRPLRHLASKTFRTKSKWRWPAGPSRYTVEKRDRFPVRIRYARARPRGRREHSPAARSAPAAWRSCDGAQRRHAPCRPADASTADSAANRPRRRMPHARARRRRQSR